MVAAWSGPFSRRQPAVRPAQRYVEAGADGVFVPGVAGLGAIRELADELLGPGTYTALEGGVDYGEMNAALER